MQLEVPALLLRVEGHLKEESDRVLHYLDTTTRKPLIEVVEQQLLQVHAMAIIERGFEPMMVRGGGARARACAHGGLVGQTVADVGRGEPAVGRTHAAPRTSAACSSCSGASMRSIASRAPSQSTYASKGPSSSPAARSATRPWWTT